MFLLNTKIRLLKYFNNNNNIKYKSRNKIGYLHEPPKYAPKLSAKSDGRESEDTEPKKTKKDQPKY